MVHQKCLPYDPVCIQRGTGRWGRPPCPGAGVEGGGVWRRRENSDSLLTLKGKCLFSVCKLFTLRGSGLFAAGWEFGHHSHTTSLKRDSRRKERGEPPRQAAREGLQATAGQGSLFLVPDQSRWGGRSGGPFGFCDNPSLPLAFQQDCHWQEPIFRESVHIRFSLFCSSSERERENKKIMDISLCPFQSNIGKRKRERSTTHRNRFCFVTGDYNIYLFIQRVFVECLPCARLYSRLGGEEWTSQRRSQLSRSYSQVRWDGNKGENRWKRCIGGRRSREVSDRLWEHVWVAGWGKDNDIWLEARVMWRLGAHVPGWGKSKCKGCQERPSSLLVDTPRSQHGGLWARGETADASLSRARSSPWLGFYPKCTGKSGRALFTYALFENDGWI